MKNLFENLKEDHKSKLDLISKIYPTTIENLIDDLRLNYFWTELKYKNICSLVNLFQLSSYTPTDINELFYE